MGDLSLPSRPKADTTKRVSPSYPKYVFSIMFAISFLNYLDRNVLNGAATTVAKELGFGIDGVGYVASAFLVVYTLCTIPLGIWADRVRRKDVVAFCVALWSIATALTALAFNFVSLFLFRMLLGVGEAGYFPAGTALMSDYFSREKRSRVMSWWNVAQLFGILLGFVLGGELAGLYKGSWRLAFLFTGIPGLILAFLAWKLREPRRNEADEAEAEAAGTSEELVPEAVTSPTNPLKQMGALLRIKSLVVLIIMQIFAFFVLSVAITFLPTLLQQRDLYGLTAGFASTFAGGVIVVAGLIGTVFGGYMADWLNSRHQGSRILVCGIGFLLSSPALLVALLSNNFVVFTIFFVITAILITFYAGPSTAATQDVAPAVLRSSAVAVSLLIAHLLGDAFSPAIVGVLAHSFDPTGGKHFTDYIAGHELSLAILVTCVPALAIAGLVGIFGARWMKSDVAAAQEADRLAREAA